MPTYEYHCDACGHDFEEFQSFSEPPLKKCPKCSKPKLRRLFGTGTAVLFKGSGFYQTDYRSESYKAAAKAEQEAGKPAPAAKDAAAGTAGAGGTTGGAGQGKEAKPRAKSSKSKK